jgi:hypothetical protein
VNHARSTGRATLALAAVAIAVTAGRVRAEAPPKPLKVEVPLGITLVDLPVGRDKAKVKGMVSVGNRPKTARSVEVRVNGVLVKPCMGDDNRCVGDSEREIPAAAGKELVITAKDGAEEARLVLPCPPEVKLTSPAAGATIKAGTPLTVTWTGPITAALYPAPGVKVIRNDDQSWKEPPGPNSKSLATGATSAELQVPKTPGQYLVELFVPGAVAKGSDGATGWCALTRRVLVEVK